MLTPLDDVRRWVLEHCAPLAPRALPVPDALGLVLAGAARAALDVPRFRNSAMDGYAVRARDTEGAPVELRVAGSVMAGAAPGQLRVERGTAARIMTGAPVPDGADAVVMVEATSDAGGGRVRVEQAVAPGANVREAGEDVAAGAPLFPAGTVLGPAYVGALVSAGVREVRVHPRARVAVVSTGDELCDTEEVEPGRIPDSNRHMLLALVREAGGDPVDGGIVPDDPAALVAGLERAADGCDALVTSGGVSVGDADHVAGALRALGWAESRRMAVKPAKPFVFGMVGGTAAFGLPGNPVSSLVSFELLARPALRRLMGHARLDRPGVRAMAEEAFVRRPDGKTHFVRAVASYGEGGFTVRSAGAQGSHQLSATARANALVVLPDGSGVSAGAAVEAILIRCE